MKSKIAIAILIIFLLTNSIVWNQTNSMIFFSNTTKQRSKIQKHSFLDKLNLIIFGISNPKPHYKKTPKDYNLSFKTLLIKENNIELETWVIENPNSSKYISLFHGAMASKDHLLDEAKEFYELGYNIVLPDFRGSGGSNQNYTTFGYLEAHDVRTVVNYVIANFNPSELILYGRSLGAASITRSISELGAKADKIILDSVYKNLEQTINNRFDLMNLPSLFFPKLMLFWANRILPINSFNIKPIDFAKNIYIPVLFLHGELDKRAKLEDAKLVYDAIPSEEKKFIIFENTRHEPLFVKNKKEWLKVINNFLGFK